MDWPVLDFNYIVQENKLRKNIKIQTVGFELSRTDYWDIDLRQIDKHSMDMKYYRILSSRW